MKKTNWKIEAATEAEIVERSVTGLREAPGAEQPETHASVEADGHLSGKINGTAGPPCPDEEPPGDAEFPTDVLPATVAAMVRESARVNRVPESLPGAVALGVLSASLGAGLSIEGRAGKQSRGNIMVLVGAASGTGKSEVFRDLAGPLRAAETELAEHWRNETLQGLLADKDVAESRLAELKKVSRKKDGTADIADRREDIKEARGELDRIEFELGREPRLLVEEATPEKLAVIAEGQTLEAIGSLSADAREVIAIVSGRYSKAGSGEGILLKMFSGDPTVIDRMGRRTVRLAKPCLAALWLVQPDKVREMFSNDSFDEGGLLARLLACDSGAEPMEIPEHVAPIAESVLKRWGNLIAPLVSRYRLAEEPMTASTSSEAAGIFREYYNDVVARRRSDLRDANHYAVRWEEQAQRLAVVLHGAEHGDRAHTVSLTAATAENAVRLAQWFGSQQIERLAVRREGKRKDRWERVEDFARSSWPEPVTARSIHRKRIVASPGDARQILAEMAGTGLFRVELRKPERGGRTVEEFHLTELPKERGGKVR